MAGGYRLQSTGFICFKVMAEVGGFFTTDLISGEGLCEDMVVVKDQVAAVEEERRQTP